MVAKLCLAVVLTLCLLGNALAGPGVSITGPRPGENRRVCGGLVVRSHYAYCRSNLSCTRNSECPRQSRCPLTHGHWRCQEGECLCWERGTNHIVAQNIYATGSGNVVGVHIDAPNTRLVIGGK